MTESLDIVSVTPGVVRGSVFIAGAKSLVHRHIVCSCMLERDSTLENVPNSADVAATIGAVRALGYPVEWNAKRGVATVFGSKRGHITSAEVFCGESGTTARLIVALCATLPGEWKLTGAGRLPKRPMENLLECLEQLGCTSHVPQDESVIVVLNVPKYLSVEKTIEVETTTSSQYLSALLLLSTRVPGMTLLASERIVSLPYVEMTVTTCQHYGYEVERNGQLFGTKKVHDTAVTSAYIEPDFSSIAYWVCAAVLTQGAVSIPNISVKSSQADARVVEILGSALEIEEHTTSLTFRGVRPFEGAEADCSECPDLVPALAITGLFAEQPSRFYGIYHLRHKESDRIETVQHMITALGGRSEYQDGILSVLPGVKFQKQCIVEPRSDHRIAMAGALAGLRLSNVNIRESKCVDKSYPDFWNHLELLTSTG